MHKLFSNLFEKLKIQLQLDIQIAFFTVNEQSKFVDKQVRAINEWRLKNLDGLFNRGEI